MTGGAGFIGRRLIAALDDSCEIAVLDALVPEVHAPGADFPSELRRRAHCVRADLGDVAAWRGAAAGVDVVVHLAALTGTGDSDAQPKRYLDHNVLATVRLCEVLDVCQPSRVVLASSRAVYGEGPYRAGDRVVYPGARRAAALAAGQWECVGAGEPMLCDESAAAQPVSFYGLTKLWQEQVLSAFAATRGIGLHVLRLQNVYGPLQDGTNPAAGIVATLARNIICGRGVELFEDGEMTRDFVHVDDVVRAIISSIEVATGQQTFNIGTGSRTSLREMVRMLSGFAGESPMVSCAGRYRLGDVRHAAADMSRYARAAGAWTPIALADGLSSYVDWLSQHLQETTCRE